MPDNPNEEFVYVRMGAHGDDVPPGRVTRLAFDTIWRAKGFVIVDNDEAELLGSPATMAEMRGGTTEPASEPPTTEPASTRKKG